MRTRGDGQALAIGVHVKTPTRRGPLACLRRGTMCRKASRCEAAAAAAKHNNGGTFPRACRARVRRGQPLAIRKSA